MFSIYSAPILEIFADINFVVCFFGASAKELKIQRDTLVTVVQYLFSSVLTETVWQPDISGKNSFCVGNIFNFQTQPSNFYQIQFR